MEKSVREIAMPDFYANQFRLVSGAASVELAALLVGGDGELRQGVYVHMSPGTVRHLHQMLTEILNSGKLGN